MMSSPILGGTFGPLKRLRVPQRRAASCSVGRAREALRAEEDSPSRVAFERLLEEHGAASYKDGTAGGRSRTSR
jgi:hypothetical protein